MKKSIIILLSVMALALAFSGCGGSAGSVESVGDTLTETPNLNLSVTSKPAGLTQFPAIPDLPEN